jgi:hypothetical protein
MGVKVARVSLVLLILTIQKTDPILQDYAQHKEGSQHGQKNHYGASPRRSR